MTAERAELAQRVRAVLPQDRPLREVGLEQHGRRPRPRGQDERERSPGTMPGMAETAGHRHHAIDYIELTVTDLGAAKAFYAGAFGWEFTDYGPEYAGIRGVEGAPEAGGLRVDTEVRPGGPLVLLFSADLDGSVAAVRDAGGTVLVEPYGFPGGRRFHFADPSGNELGVWAES